MEIKTDDGRVVEISDKEYNKLIKDAKKEFEKSPEYAEFRDKLVPNAIADMLESEAKEMASEIAKEELYGQKDDRHKINNYDNGMFIAKCLCYAEMFRLISKENT